MIIFPYSTALSLAKPPLVTYITAALCVVVFYFQLSSGITDTLKYYPASWNPLNMVTSIFAHGSWTHLLGNLIFFLAFAPALEALIGSTLRYIALMLFIALVTGVSYSIATLIGSIEALPTLGFSGVVMGMIGLSAYMMPLARIRVFGWFILFWKIFYVPAWILALFYIGLDLLEMISAESYGGINLVAHVAGGLAGYGFGFVWLKQRREEIREELEAEIDVMHKEQKYRATHSVSYRRSKELEQLQAERQQAKEDDRFMATIYQMTTTNRDSEAILLLMEKYDYFKTDTVRFETLFEYVQKWGASRTLLCIGRLIIFRLNEERRHGRCLFFIEKCLQISPQFILPDLKQTVFYARMAFDNDKLAVAERLIQDADKRFGKLVNLTLCRELMAQIERRKAVI